MFTLDEKRYRSAKFSLYLSDGKITVTDDKGIVILEERKNKVFQVGELLYVVKQNTLYILAEIEHTPFNAVNIFSELSSDMIRHNGKLFKTVNVESFTW